LGFSKAAAEAKAQAETRETEATAAAEKAADGKAGAAPGEDKDETAGLSVYYHH
jgi:hypothetical protein